MTAPKIRCAIYTRKSSDEGLDQEFNSLDAQYEACAAYITSQRLEGWKLITKRYDDGGISGGTLKRLGLQALLEDIDAGLVDRIVVYKIDRLTRSLGDFSKIVDRLEASEASFVSVTQSFNTATSMGRLTLNMLLSFAQFEREVTAERIRDKIAASKAKGMWMGGNVPLGYDTHPDKTARSLVPNERETRTVQMIFDLYLEHGCLRRVEIALARHGLRSKPRKTHQGAIFTRGAIHKILTNPLYKGKIRHKDKTYEGLHSAIISDMVWDSVQEKLQSKGAKRRGSHLGGSPDAPLKGKVFDETGDQLTPTHTKKNGRIIRYYISNRLIKQKDPTGWRLPAKTFEPAIAQLIVDHLINALDEGDLLANADINQIKDVRNRLLELKSGLSDNPATSLKLIDALLRADLQKSALRITLNPDQAAAFVQIGSGNINHDALTFTSQFSLRKRGVEAKLITGDYQPAPDQALLRALAKAHHWAAQHTAGRPLTKIAIDEGVCDSLIRTRMPLAFLSPKIQKAIMDGTQPTDLTLSKLKRIKLSANWHVQEQQLGF